MRKRRMLRCMVSLRNDEADEDAQAGEAHAAARARAKAWAWAWVRADTYWPGCAPRDKEHTHQSRMVRHRMLLRRS